MMRRLLLFLSFVVACPLCLQAQFRDSYYSELQSNETIDGFVEHVKFLSSEELRGRAAGSDGEAAAADYIERQFSLRELDILIPESGVDFGILRKDGSDTLRSRNVLAYLQGYDPALRNEYIVIGARMDNLGVASFEKNGIPVEKVYYGANGNASGLAMLIQLAGRLSENRVLCRRSIIFAAFGASLCDNAGSWYFLNRSFPEKASISAMVNLDMLGTFSSGFYAYSASNADLDKLLTEMSNTLQPVQPQMVSQEPVSSDHRSFYASEIPSVFFTTGMYPEYNTDRDVPSIVQYDYMERELEYIYNFTLQLCNGNRPAFRFVPREAVRKIEGEKVYSYHECDQPPAFINSTDPKKFMQEWVYKYLKYPEDALREGIQGRVLVDFMITEKGKLVDARVVKGVDPLLDEEALRVISLSPDWKPAKHNGKKVKCEMSLYVEFRLKRKAK